MSDFVEEYEVKDYLDIPFTEDEYKVISMYNN